MQFFPAAVASAVSSGAPIAADLFGDQGLNLFPDTQHANFDAVLASFIEEGRESYSGRPAGFSALEKNTGALDESQGRAVIESLRKRKVDDESLRSVEQLLASGAPVTVSGLMSLLSGESRRGAALEGAERDAFVMLLGKLGFDKNETDEMLGLSDDGAVSALWKKLTGKLGTLDGLADVDRTEFSALLKGLDVSEETGKALLKLFGQGSERKLGGAELEAMLAGVGKEFAKREKDAAYARTQIRSAVDEALKAAKAREAGMPVEDKRGSRRSEQSEAVMQDSVLKKTGVADLKRDQTDAREDGEASFSRRDNRPVFEQPGEGEEGAEGRTRTRGADEKAGEGISRLLRGVVMAASQSRTSEAPDQAPNQAQNLNTLARNFRQEIFSQVESGILQNAHNGARQLTLQLNPGELGQLTVLLSVRQGEVSATIRTENQDTSSVIREQLVELKASLEAQGLKVKELDVQTQLRDNAFANQWNGCQEHNLMRDSSERDRLIRLGRMRRDAGDGGGGADLSEVRAYATESTGLHIVA